MFNIICAGCFVITAAISIQCYFHHRLPRWLPRSFTVGEAAIIAQAAATFSLYASRLYISAVSYKAILLSSRCGYCLVCKSVPVVAHK